ncbi:hypothetical protein HMPREF9120_00449 [Neisseria sp. oral taxon 020 str. F0370]|nr:hypothetical protein HMPREF9120_00449 [Neisseria sp. oral taxon 020 str. F0370]
MRPSEKTQAANEKGRLKTRIGFSDGLLARQTRNSDFARAAGAGIVVAVAVESAFHGHVVKTGQCVVEVVHCAVKIGIFHFAAPDCVAG